MEINKNTKVAVLGSGSWGTALVKILCENLEKVGWYFRDETKIAYILEHKHNPNYLSSIEFNTEQVFLSNNLNELLAYADIIFLATPSAFLEETLSKIKISLADVFIFSCIKGIIPQTELTIREHLHKKYKISYENIGIFTGPCHAEEVAMEHLSYLTVACEDFEKAKDLTHLFKSDYIKCKASNDVIGTEYSVILKNIYAIAAGIANGLGYGDNFQAVLISNSIREMKRFVKKIYKTDRNINHSAYLGDLLVTSYSIFSRNRMFGNRIGKGYSVKSIISEMNMVAEGYYALKNVYKIYEKYNIKMPIIKTVYNIVHHKKNPKKQFKNLSEKLD